MSPRIRILNPRLQPVTNSFAATYSVHLDANSKFEAPWIEPLLQSVADHLAAFSGSDWRARLVQLAKIHRPQEPISFYVDGPANAEEIVVEFLRRVPVLTEDQVVERLKNHLTEINLKNLMQVSLADTTFYIADQFADNGSVHPECVQIMTLFRQDSSFLDWEIAMWWINPTGWLGGERPCNLFKENFNAVKYAAERELSSE
ncbi:MAG: hypothetical protein ABUL52_00685 [Solimonas sp.]